MAIPYLRKEVVESMAMLAIHFSCHTHCQYLLNKLTSVQLEEFIRGWLGERRLEKPQENLSAYAICCSSRSANEEPRKETKEVKYSGE